MILQIEKQYLNAAKPCRHFPLKGRQVVAENTVEKPHCVDDHDKIKNYLFIYTIIYYFTIFFHPYNR